MEADWDVEIGPDSPSIEIPWEGFIDLRNDPNSAVQVIPEADAHPALGDALIRLNSGESALFTSKCDAWQLKHDEIDPYEFSALPEDARSGFASYIDVLLSDQDRFQSFEFHEGFVRRITGELRVIDLAECRVDLVVRAATINSSSGYGVTLYAAGCGRNPSMALLSWQRVLDVSVNATMRVAQPSTTGE
jgi:hypothetical protein